MTAGLSSPRGSYIDAVVASTFRFVLAVKSVGCTCVVLLLTWNWSFVGFHSNPSVVSPSSLSRDNVCCVSCSSLGLLSKNVDWFEAHFLSVIPAVWSRGDISCCTLIASSMCLRCHLVNHLHKSHSSAFEHPLGIDTCCHLLISLGNVLPGIELKRFHM